MEIKPAWLLDGELCLSVAAHETLADNMFASFNSCTALLQAVRYGGTRSERKEDAEDDRFSGTTATTKGLIRVKAL